MKKFKQLRHIVDILKWILTISCLTLRKTTVGVSTKFAGSSCHDIVCLPDTHNVISCHYDKQIRFWDLRADSPSQQVSLPDKVTSLDLSLNQCYLLASVRDDSLHVLDLRMNSVIGQCTWVGEWNYITHLLVNFLKVIKFSQRQVGGGCGGCRALLPLILLHYYKISTVLAVFSLGRMTEDLIVFRLFFPYS